MKECSFKPRINKKMPQNPKFKYDKNNLYKKKDTKQTKTTEEMEYEKERKECTFAPKLVSKNAVTKPRYMDKPAPKPIP